MEKLRIVAKTRERGATVRAVALGTTSIPACCEPGGVRPATAFYHPEQAHLVPVHLSDPAPSPMPPLNLEPTATGLIEVVLPDAIRLRLGDDISTIALRRVIAVLRG